MTIVTVLCIKTPSVISIGVFSTWRF